MILPDLNLLIYAYNSDAPLHKEARRWWERQLNGTTPVVIPWAVTCGFIRMMTHPRILINPMSPSEATARARVWFEQTHVRPINSGNRHFEILATLLQEAGVAANLTTDAHLAAIAIEYQCELHSNDTDFSRFQGLQWRNPL